MKKSAVSFFIVLLGASPLASAQEEKSLFGSGTWYGGRQSGELFVFPSVTPLYYRPTQRYYGNGFTINYRYVPVYKSDGPHSATVTGSSNFRTEAFHLPTENAPSWGAYSPRLMVRDSKSAAPRTAITTIVRKKTTTKIPSKASEESAPPITPSASEATGGASASPTAPASPASSPTNP